MEKPVISILIPLYNEKEVFPVLTNRLNAVMEQNKNYAIEIVLVDDGSTDGTANLIRMLAYADPRYQGVFLSRNFGHQLALTAGLPCCNAANAIFIIDGDLQDPPELLPQFYTKMLEGYDVVYAVRKNRKENYFKKATYYLFYRIFNAITKIKMPLDSGDFSLISRRVANILCKMPEESRFIRGMRSWVGFSQTGIEYERDSRTKGKSKYSFRALLRLAYSGIFNFSEFPVKFIKRIGYVAIVVAMGYLFYNMYAKFIMHAAIPQGYTSLLFILIFFSGLQFVSIGLLGEYVLRVFFQVKNRPLFIIKERIENQEAREEYGSNMFKNK